MVLAVIVVFAAPLCIPACTRGGRPTGARDKRGPKSHGHPYLGHQIA
jgi:hypothetical protein